MIKMKWYIILSAMLVLTMISLSNLRDSKRTADTEKTGKEMIVPVQRESVKWKNSNCEDTDDDYTLKSFMTGKHTNVFFML
jgi:hypothetical protein